MTKLRASKQSSEQQIEILVRERKTVTAQSAIQHWLKIHHDIDARTRACDWFRRLGDLGRAYRVVAPQEFKLKKANLSASEVKQYLWCARILNLMGASHYALQIASQISPLKSSARNADEWRVLGNIYLANFDFKNAYQNFQAGMEVDAQPDAYASRLGRISLCDALAGLGQYDRALRELKKIEVRADESLLQGILLQAEGEYLARERKYKAAVEVCHKAIQFFSKEDASPDYAFMLKWMGIAKIASGAKKEGLHFLNLSLRLLKKPSNRPEMWLDCFYWKQELGVATREERDTLTRYPGQPVYYLNRYELHPAVASASAEADLQIYLARKEWRWKSDSKPSLSKEIELAAWVRLSHPHGLPLYRAFTLLWPDELNSFLQLEDRIHQLLKRLREIYGLECFIQDKNLFFSKTSALRVEVDSSTENTPLPFMKSLRIRRSELMEFYGLGSTQVHHLIQRWTGEGVVKTSKQGRKTWIEWLG